MSYRHFMDLVDVGDGATIERMLADAKARKAARAGLPKGQPDADAPLVGHTLGAIFEGVEKSTRTRVSFDMAIRQLGGGGAIVLDADSIQLGGGESVADTARVLSRYVDALVYRTDEHRKLAELARHATVPVINGLTLDRSHPCQMMADLLTVSERFGRLDGLQWAWVGDEYNVLLDAIIEASSLLDFNVRFSCPGTPAVYSNRGSDNARVQRVIDPIDAVRGADVVVTGKWVQMYDDPAAQKSLLAPYQVNESVMAAAPEHAIFLHCLPAYRGDEVTAGVIDGPRSAVWDEAENRLHAQKSVLLWALGKLN